MVVVLGKPTINKIEYDPLFFIGRALALRNKQLRTTKTEGACAAIVAGYESQGQSPEYITKGGLITEGAESVVVFTDAKYQAKLTERYPTWKDQPWLVIHNRKATTEAATMVKQILEDLGTPLTDD